MIRKSVNRLVKYELIYFAIVLLFTEFTKIVGNEINHVYSKIRHVVTPFRRLSQNDLPSNLGHLIRVLVKYKLIYFVIVLLFTEFTKIFGNEINHVCSKIRHVVTPFRRLSQNDLPSNLGHLIRVSIKYSRDDSRGRQAAQVNCLLPILKLLIILMMEKDSACAKLYIRTPWRGSQPKEFLLHSIAMEASKTHIDYVCSYIHL
jgi:hypothetical protein